MKYVLSVLSRSAGAQGHVRHIGDFDSLEDAVAGAKRVVDAVLERVYVSGMTATELVDQYRAQAEAPFIARDDEGTMNAGSFNHFQYARVRSEQICTGAG